MCEVVLLSMNLPALATFTLKVTEWRSDFWNEGND